MNELVTVVTPTIGTKYLKQNIESIQNQTYKDIQHLIFIDGRENLDKVSKIIKEMGKLKDNVDIIPLPYSVGNERWNGHRMYAASIYLCKGELISFLDEDNWFDTDHIESMVNACDANHWSFSRRKIVDSDGSYVCNDDCESLGDYPSIINDKDFFVDLNCFMIRKSVGLQVSQYLHRKFREPGQPEVDRVLTSILRNNSLQYKCNNKYSVNYRAGNTENSVTKQFFINGNKIMLEKYNGKLPWLNEEKNENIFTYSTLELP